jgi:hypothetical protein
MLILKWPKPMESDSEATSDFYSLITLLAGVLELLGVAASLPFTDLSLLRRDINYSKSSSSSF